MADFTMPSLGADMQAATLVKWRVAPGDTVKRGDVVAEVETEKGLIDIECFENGVVERLTVAPGTKVPVGDVMAVIAPSTDEASAQALATRAQAATPVARKAAEALGVDLASVHGTGPGGRIDRADVERAARERHPAEAALRPPVQARPRLRVSPLARTRAAALGVDLSLVTGTGPGGSIEAADVERAAPAPVTTAAPPTAAASASMRRAIAAAMAKSKREIPHYYLQTRIDMSAAVAWLQAENQQRPIEQRLLPVVVLLRSVARALVDVPALNGFWIDDQFRAGPGIHLGFAIALKGGGLVAPAIHDVDRRTPGELMAHLHDLIPRARAGRLRSSEMTDATLTVTSLGDLGVDSVLGVIYPPQVGLVGFGRIAEAPWAERGMIGARPVVAASLAADHRASDGLTGGRFLDALARHLQHPEQP